MTEAEKVIIRGRVSSSEIKEGYPQIVVILLKETKKRQKEDNPEKTEEFEVIHHLEFTAIDEDNARSVANAVKGKPIRVEAKPAGEEGYYTSESTITVGQG